MTLTHNDMEAIRTKRLGLGLVVTSSKDGVSKELSFSSIASRDSYTTRAVHNGYTVTVASK